MSLTAERVQQLFLYCLFEKEEVLTPNTPPEGAVVVEGISAMFAFQPTRIEESTPAISQLLDQLPDMFQKGWSFLNLCVTKDGEQWGEHVHMEQLLVLGLAIGKVSYVAPRDMWRSFPGGLPYLIVH